eukprot:TRINITY_DN484_c0_g2_i1.p1 TRINITY_DN484_c0_g2~~TRINITY_DN484_c0_g2_i1.p1  ORF type:complete len:256 (+),score=58.61 TRINITY_DN484_c0_g2_i1:63-830(+)
MLRTLLTLTTLAACNAANIVIAGDSWGTYGKEPFLDMLKRHNSSLTVDNIAVGGTTTDNWLKGRDRERFEKAVNESDVKVVWLTLMGNDAQAFLPGCADKGGSTDQCSDELVAMVTKNMQDILNYVKNHTNPSTKVVGFGYDIMGFGDDNGLLCRHFPGILFPHCDKDIPCFNVHFERLQGVWKTLSEKNEFVNEINLLGSIQAGAGDPAASIGHPDINKYSPGAYMRDNCIHPNDKGFEFVFDNFWNLYLSKVQ